MADRMAGTISASRPGRACQAASFRCFARGGAIEALVEARNAGKVRRIGFTGHKSPMWHLEMLRLADAHGFSFDAVQMPLNVLDAHGTAQNPSWLGSPTGG